MDGYAVLMGDFNVVNPVWVATGGGYHKAMEGCPEMIEESGWVYLPSNVRTADIDHIWVSPIMGDYDFIPMMHRSEFLVHYSQVSLVSDHNPIAVDVFFP
jgi:endonuclease/exonuclease/phosphatase family metal-dependent hydrolase